MVLQYLLKNTDEDHIATAFDIIAFLEDECGIEAERRSIYKDIEEINKVALMFQQECTIDEAIDMLEEDEDDSLKLVKYDKSRKGFYVQSAVMRLFCEVHCRRTGEAACGTCHMRLYQHSSSRKNQA